MPGSDTTPPPPPPPGEPPGGLPGLFEEVLNTPPAARDEAVAQLQADNEALRDSKRDERFCWILIVVVLLDLLFLERMQSWASIILIGIVQVLLIIALAVKLGVQQVVLLINRVIDSWGKTRG